MQEMEFVLSEVCRLYGGRFSYHRLADRVRSGVIPARKGVKSWYIAEKDLPLVECEFGIESESKASIAA